MTEIEQYVEEVFGKQTFDIVSKCVELIDRIDFEYLEKNQIEQCVEVYKNIEIISGVIDDCADAIAEHDLDYNEEWAKIFWFLTYKDCYFCEPNKTYRFSKELRDVVGLGRTMKTVFERANNFWALSIENERLKVQLEYAKENAKYRKMAGIPQGMLP